VLNTAKSHLIEWKKMPMDTYAETNGYSLEEAYGWARGFGEVEDEMLITRVRESCLQMFMNCMPPKYRSVYTLRGMLQFSAKDTAEILDISEDAVKTNLHRARKHARDHLKGRCSLVKPGSLCDCRAIAAYIKHNDRLGRIQNIDVIRRREAEAVENFTQEMTELLAVEGLFATELVGLDYDTFKERLKGLKKEGAFTLLDY
jgi:RNA polymerase sigma-70 factor (ECF subfamily)